ncbi:tetratricopeptide repeat protein 34, partial [Sorex araneus]|uniref:tetratricopeptide repeat protein 34 n=1 Tax=Sorex araneus TaxID=42254 RepID=UPI00243392BE
ERLLRRRRAGPAGERPALLALRGFCALHAGDAPRALEDFQAVVARGPPHPCGCVRALCGRGLLRVLAGSAFLGALDYVTACRLRREEALLVAKAWVPWNQRGLLRTVLREEARTLLRRAAREAADGAGPAAQEGDAHGVLQLASLLLELDAEDEESRLLVADALYSLGRLDDAHRALLLAQSRRPPAAPALARLALLQLRRGFCYDAHQLVKKLVQCGDTACLQPTLGVFCHEDRQRLWHLCHTRAVATLRARPGVAGEQTHLREAVAYLSLAIFAAGGSCLPPPGTQAVPGTQAGQSLLARARCYALLGQRKTALLDFNAALRAEPGNVAALCGRALLHLALGRQQEAVDDVLCALKLDPRAAVPELRALKPEVQALVTQGLSSRCRALLGRVKDASTTLSPDDARGLQAAAEALVSLDSGRCSGHILLADVLTVRGSYEEAGARLQAALHPCPPSEAARARRGLLQLKKGDAAAAARDLQGLAETDASDLGFLLGLLDAPERQSLAQAAAQEASSLLRSGQAGPALGYCSLAVLASADQAPHLRLRAACLAELQEFDRALGDLGLVLREGSGAGDASTRAEDFCSQGRLLLGLGDEAGAARAFVQGLQLAPLQARSSLDERPGRTTAARLLLGWGQRCLEEQRLAEAWAAVDAGLALDPSHGSLRGLRTRLRREAASGCQLH